MNTLKHLSIWLVVAILFPATLRAQKEPVLPTVKEVATAFKSPEAKYSPSILWGWEGPVTREVIERDLDRFKSLHVKAVNIEAGYDLPFTYLSDGYFDLVKHAMEQARQRGIVVWMIDECKYPSGFAGGKFSRERPDLRMQGLDFWRRIDLPSGQTFSEELPAAVLSAVAVERKTGESRLLSIKQGRLTWTAPEGDWQVWLVRHKFRTSVTRAGNNPTHGKDTMNALCDYLNPDAVYQFIQFTHEQYKKHVGQYFGTTFLGFRGDEPDYGFVPWTTNLPMTFQMKKGYDVRPWVAGFLVKNPTDSMLRVKADYWDVWSDMFGENFFKVQADWCAANGISYMTHLNHEDQMMSLARSSGDLFKNLRNVQIPGVDAIWNQIWPGKVADFPKYAASVAHVFGKQYAMSESFAAYNTPPDASQAKWVTDHQLVRGINKFEWMYWPASTKGPGQPRGWFGDPRFPQIAQYTTRVCYLLSQGMPGADFAVYYPTPSMWMGYAAADSSTLQLCRFLLENQRDFDFVDDYAIEHSMRPTNQGYRNWSGQEYKVILVPSVYAMSDRVLERLKAFTNRGGKVIFTGTLPSLIVRKNFRKADGNYDFSPMFRASGLQILSYLPDPDFRLTYTAPAVKYNHRKLADADLYFVFNEGETAVDNTVTLAGTGKAQFWDPASGEITPCTNAVTANNQTEIPLKLAPWETRVIVIAR